MVDKLNIQSEMAAFDLKDRGFYDDLTEEERKKFSPFLMIRWGSAVEGSRELQEYYVIATNERLNKHFFSINGTQHRKMHWLMSTSVSPGLGRQRHSWIAPYKRDKSNSAKRRALARMRPDLDDPELDVLMAITTQKEINEWIKNNGDDV